MDCPFCYIDRKPIRRTTHMTLIESKFAVADKGHYLIIPNRHIESCYELEFYEWDELKLLMAEAKYICQKNGYVNTNVGFNDGVLAGQTIMHAHIHVIGRKKGDVKDPRGGIRNVIPAKGNYLKKEKM